MIKVGLVGIGKIAKEQHIPAIQHSSNFTLSCTVSRNTSIIDVPNFETIHEALVSDVEIDLVSLCAPANVRFKMAKEAILSKKHVLLEKPPAANCGELDELERLAEKQKVSLIYSWHSRHAPMVEKAKKWLRGKHINRVNIAWLEDVEEWHPGQEWVWQPGGFGAFDSGINALSILTKLIPNSYRVLNAELTYLGNKQTPIRSRFVLVIGNEIICNVELDWQHKGKAVWDIQIETDEGQLILRKGGNQLLINGQDLSTYANNLAEYQGVYESALCAIENAKSDCDGQPLSIVSDVMMIGTREVGAK